MIKEKFPQESEGQTHLAYLQVPIAVYFGTLLDQSSFKVTFWLSLSYCCYRVTLRKVFLVKK